MTEEPKDNILYPAGSMGLRTKRNIVLIGFKGTGKSTVAMHLHELYHMDVAEMDEIMAKREEMSITNILLKKGEPYLRNLETNLLIELQQRDNLIIICDGQTPLFDKNVKIMKQNSFIVLMTASPDKIYKRVYQKKEHTPAEITAIIEKTRRSMAERLPKYEGIANMIINTDEMSTPQIAFDIIHNMMEKAHWLNTINPEIFIRNTKTFDNLMMMYRGTIREIQTKLEVLDDEFSNKYNRNPIAFIKTRIKKPMSIYQKLLRLGYDFTEENIREQLNDVAGIRVICPFIDDIYTVAGLLSEQDDIHVIHIKDYIKNPKENGYRSYHLIVDIPVFFSTGKTLMRAEIQIRTIGMDFWASLEHQLRYKKGMDKIEGYEKISEELQKYSKTIIETDNHMQAIKDMIGDFYDI